MRRRVSQQAQGFTLLELLVAMTIFALIGAALYAAFDRSETVIDAARSQAEINIVARTAMERIALDLRGIFPGTGGRVEGHRQEIAGRRADTLQFVSTAHVALTREELPAGLALIRYTVVEDPATRLLKLYRLDIPYRPGYLSRDLAQDTGEVLGDRLRSVRLVYFDQVGNALEDWQVKAEVTETAEDSVQAPGVDVFPAMIEVELHFADDRRDELVFRTAVALPQKKQKRKIPGT